MNSATDNPKVLDQRSRPAPRPQHPFVAGGAKII
jgi:hypothetical protein